MKLSRSENDLFAYIDTVMPDDGHLVYDFTDDRQFQFAKMMARKFGNAERCPGALKALVLFRQQHQDGVDHSADIPAVTGGWQNFFTIPGLGLSRPANQVSSDGMATITGGYGSMNLAIIVQNDATKQIVANGFNNDFRGELLTVETTNNPTGTADMNVTSYLHYTYSLPQASAEEMALVGSSGVVTRKAASGPASDPHITAPVRTTTKPKHPDAINIGLGRAWIDQGGSSPFDYAWNELPSAHPVGKIPFVGEVEFTIPIKTPMEPKTGLILNIYVADTTGGGVGHLPAQEMDHVYSKFSVSPTDPKKLVWNLPPGKNTSDVGDPLTFGSVTWNSDINAFFYCGINVILSDNNLGTAAVQSKMTPDDDDLDGTLEIRPIDFIWHCLGEDTTVAMADGEERPIGDILAGDVVMLDADERPVTVVWTNKGGHKGDVVRIETTQGHHLTASGNHVIMTVIGGVPANELSIGDEIFAANGNTKISDICREATYDGMMYNLATRDHQDAKDFDGNIATFVANGIIVGDVNAQRALRHQRRNDIEWVKARVSPIFHTDIDNKFEDMGCK